jgi:hypothetical protein
LCLKETLEIAPGPRSGKHAMNHENRLSHRFILPRFRSARQSL